MTTASATTKTYANRIGFSDVEPYEVVRTISETTIEVRQMSVIRNPAWTPDARVGGFVANVANNNEQRWTIVPNENGSLVRLRRRKNGNWHSAGGCRFMIEAEPRMFYDFNF